MTTTADLANLVLAFIASIGGGAVIVAGVATWVGKVWATRLAEQDRAQYARDLEKLKAQIGHDLERDRAGFAQALEEEKARLAHQMESYRSDLSELSSLRKDALTRKRDIYATLASSMRIFVGKGRHATEDQRREFLRAYDVSCLWASEEVVAAVGEFLDAMKASVGGYSVVDQDEVQQLYRACMLAMRRDCGFPETALEYRLVTF